jgi:hypothetical protein
MLSANVGFLAIPGVVISNLSGIDITSASQVRIFTSPAQIASSLSMLASIGGIMIGLLLVRHNRTKVDEDPPGAVCVYSLSTYVPKQLHCFRRHISIKAPTDFSVLNHWLLLSVFRGHCLCGRTLFLTFQDVFSAHIHGITCPPWMMDRMVIFFIALLLYCFNISNMSTRISVSVSSVMIAPLVVGCILICRRSSEDGELWQNSLKVLKRSLDGLFAPLKHFRLRPARPNQNDVGSTHAMTERQEGAGV